MPHPTDPAPHPCVGCGRAVAYRSPRARRLGGGKPRVRHHCAHGVPCVFGSRFVNGGGWNGPASGGPFHCPQCWEVYRARYAQVTP